MEKLDRRTARVRFLTAALAVGSMVGCDVRSTEDWVPGLGATGEESAVAATQDRVEPAWAAPSVLRIVDSAGSLRALAVRTGPGLFWTAERLSLPTEPALAGDSDDAPRALTTVSEDPLSATLALAQGIDEGLVVPARQLPLQVGARLQRWSVGADGIEREVIDILAVNERRIRTSCPRSGAGLVFDRSGAWVPAVWVPDPAGGCPLLARILPPRPAEAIPAP
jgi:hypothetical protein